MSKTHNEEIPVLASSGNLFADLGRPDAEEALARVRLAQQIAEIIERKALSQADAAVLMGLDQPKVPPWCAEDCPAFQLTVCSGASCCLVKMWKLSLGTNPATAPKPISA